MTESGKSPTTPIKQHVIWATVLVVSLSTIAAVSIRINNNKAEVEKTEAILEQAAETSACTPILELHPNGKVIGKVCNETETGLTCTIVAQFDKKDIPETSSIPPPKPSSYEHPPNELLTI